jgi:hypothetical protein
LLAVPLTIAAILLGMFGTGLSKIVPRTSL